MRTSKFLALLLFVSGCTTAAPDYQKYDLDAESGPQVQCYEEAEKVLIFWVFEGNTDLSEANNNPRQGGHLLFNVPRGSRELQIGNGFCSHDIGANMKTARKCVSGKVLLDSIAESGEISGSYSIVLEDGAIKSSDITAPVCPWTYEKWLQKNSR